MSFLKLISQAFPPPLPQSPLVFFPAVSLALFFARALLSERLEQANCPHGRSFEISKGEGNILKESMKITWNSQRGGRFKLNTFRGAGIYMKFSWNNTKTRKPNEHFNRPF